MNGNGKALSDFESDWAENEPIDRPNMDCAFMSLESGWVVNTIYSGYIVQFEYKNWQT